MGGHKTIACLLGKGHGKTFGVKPQRLDPGLTIVPSALQFPTPEGELWNLPGLPGALTAGKNMLIHRLTFTLEKAESFSTQHWRRSHTLLRVCVSPQTLMWVYVRPQTLLKGDEWAQNEPHDFDSLSKC